MKARQTLATVAPPRDCLLFRALSASRIRRSRACWRVERDSLIRPMAILSGWMLKFPIVWWMSCHMRSVPSSCVEGRWQAHRCGIFVEQHLQVNKDRELRWSEGASIRRLAEQVLVYVAVNNVRLSMWIVGCAIGYEKGSSEYLM